MKVLQAVLALGPDVDLAYVAEKLGGHPNGTRRHLDALVEEGLLESSTRKTRQSGRPAKLYSVTDVGRKVEAGTRLSGTQGEVLSLLTAHLDADGDGPGTARALGQEWGAREQGSDAVESLRHQGFAPAEGDDDGDIVLLACPMRDAVRANAKVACELHRGFLEGVLGADAGRVELVPFGSPRGCVVRIRRDDPEEPQS